MAPLRTTATALVAAPSSVAAVTALMVHSALGGPVLALRFAVLAGALTLIALIAALSQETIRSWISHRAEQRRAAAEAHAIKTLFMAATGGPARTAEDARQRRRDARAFAEAIGLTDVGRTSLGDAMQITRGRDPQGAATPSRGPCLAARCVADTGAADSGIVDPGIIGRCDCGRCAGGPGVGRPCAGGSCADGQGDGRPRRRGAAQGAAGLDLPLAAAERPVRSVPPPAGEA